MATQRVSTGRGAKRRASGIAVLPLARRRYEVWLQRGRLVRVTVNGRTLAAGLPVVLRVQKGDTVRWRSLEHDHVVNFGSHPVLGTKNVLVEVGAATAAYRPVGTGRRGRAAFGPGQTVVPYSFVDVDDSCSQCDLARIVGQYMIDPGIVIDGDPGPWSVDVARIRAALRHAARRRRH